MPSPLPKNAEIAVGLQFLRLLQLVYERSDGRFGAQVWTLPILGARAISLPILLLRTRGRRSGLTRTAALLYYRDGDDLLVVGSKGGSDSPPAWLLNLTANPQAEVQVGRDRWLVVARLAAGRERPALWRKVNSQWDYDAYQRRTEREIPVVVLSPKSRPT